MITLLIVVLAYGLLTAKAEKKLIAIKIKRNTL